MGKEEKRVKVDIEKFVRFHKDRITLLKEFRDKKIHGRLIFQISFLGFESLAKLLYLKEPNSKNRFISLLSISHVGIEKYKAEELYNFWRNSLIHQGFISYPWTILEGWDEDDTSFLSFPDGLKSSVEYPPGSIIAIYESLTKYLEDYFKEKGIKKIELLD